jgi:hypothetical protein
MVLMLLATVYLMGKLVSNFTKTPMVIYTDDSAVEVTEIYFPAVTFCPDLIIKTDVEKVFDYEKVKNSIENGLISLDNLTKSE